MMTAQRRSELKKYMLEHKSASVLEMARRFSVSGQTIRRDFEVLENEGFLLRSYGGAMVKDRKTVTEPNQVKSALVRGRKAGHLPPGSHAHLSQRLHFHRPLPPPPWPCARRSGVCR